MVRILQFQLNLHQLKNVGKQLNPISYNLEKDITLIIAIISTPAPSDEGTWGSGSECVYFWTPAGQYFRSNMAYVYSDKPFRPSSEPLLVITHTEEKKDVQPAATTGSSKKQ